MQTKATMCFGLSSIAKWEIMIIKRDLRPIMSASARVFVGVEGNRSTYLAGAIQRSSRLNA